MTICLRCHRPLKHPTESGFGRVCEKLAAPVADVECDLFGYDIEAAALAAMARLAFIICIRADMAKFHIRHDFDEARRRLGVRP